MVVDVDLISKKSAFLEQLHGQQDGNMEVDNILMPFQSNIFQ